MPGKNLNLLCIDGGGVKGLSALCIIGKLMALVDPETPPKPCDYFDIIGGTSTGGLIAIMLGRLKMTVDECIEAYLELQDRIFTRQRRLPLTLTGQLQERYDHEALEVGVQDLLVSRDMEKDALLRADRKEPCKVFVTATAEESKQTKILTSYYQPRGSIELWRHTKVWEAARATAAASGFFLPATIGPTERRFMDGGTGANNPVWKLWEEAQSLLGADELLVDHLNCLISVGTGIAALKTMKQTGTGLYDLLISTATETESTAEVFRRQHDKLFREGMCYRFSAPSVGDIDMDRPEQKNAIMERTEHYILKQDTWLQLEKCSSQIRKHETLAKRSRASTRHVSRYDPVRRHLALSTNDDAIRDELEILRRVSDYDQDETCSRLAVRRCPGTTDWLINEPNFDQWLHADDHSCLVLSGIMGSGKTKIATTVIEFLEEAAPRLGRLLAHFFFQPDYPQRLSALHFLEATVQQLVASQAETSAVMRKRLARCYGAPGRRPDAWRLFEQVVMPLASETTGAIIAVDGIDSCSKEDRADIVRFLEGLVSRGLKIFVTFRDSDDLRRRLPKLLEIRLDDTCPAARDDIRTFIDRLVSDMLAAKPILLEARTRKVVKETLLLKGEMMLLWIELSIKEIWASCFNDAQVLQCLENGLPKDLDDAYRKCQDRVPEQLQRKSRLILSLVSAAVIPFPMDALRTIVAVSAHLQGFKDETSEPSPVEVLTCGADLLFTDRNGIISTVHHSVQRHIFDDKTESARTTQGRRLAIERHIGAICVDGYYDKVSAAMIQYGEAKQGVKWMTGFSFVPSGIARSVSTRIGLSTVPPDISIKLWQSRPKTLYLSAAFHAYAQKTWVHNNRHIETGRGVHWRRFEELLDRNDGRVAFPWQRTGESTAAHLMNMLMWAVTHSHRPIIGKVAATDLAVKLKLFDKPLLPPGDGFPIHHAAKTRDVAVFEALSKRADMLKQDADGNTALHLAAFAGCHAILASKSVGSRAHSLFSTSKMQNANCQTLLHLAVLSGDRSSILTILEWDDWWGGLDHQRMIMWKDHEGHTPLAVACDLLGPADFDMLLTAIDQSLRNRRLSQLQLYDPLIEHAMAVRRPDIFCMLMRRKIGYAKQEWWKPLIRLLAKTSDDWIREIITLLQDRSPPSLFEHACIFVVERSDRLLAGYLLHIVDPLVLAKFDCSTVAAIIAIELKHSCKPLHEQVADKVRKPLLDQTLDYSLKSTRAKNSMDLAMIIQNLLQHGASITGEFLRGAITPSSALHTMLSSYELYCIDDQAWLKRALTTTAHWLHASVPAALVLSAIRSCLECGAVQYPTGLFGQFAILDLTDLRVEAGYTAVLEIMLARRKMRRLQGRLHDIALLLASSHGLSEDVEDLIVNVGADPNSSCGGQTTALDEACMRGHLDTIKVLLKHGADPSSGVAQIETRASYVHDKTSCRVQHGTVLLPGTSSAMQELLRSAQSCGSAWSSQRISQLNWYTLRDTCEVPRRVVWVHHRYARPQPPTDQDLVLYPEEGTLSSFIAPRMRLPFLDLDYHAWQA